MGRFVKVVNDRKASRNEWTTAGTATTTTNNRQINHEDVGAGVTPATAVIGLEIIGRQANNNVEKDQQQLHLHQANHSSSNDDSDRDGHKQASRFVDTVDNLDARAQDDD